MMSYTSTRFFDFGKQAILSSENNASLVYSSSSTTIRERNTIFLFDYFDSNLIFCLDVSSAINPAEPIPVILFFVFDFVLIDFLLLFWLHDTKHLIYYKKKNNWSSPKLWREKSTFMRRIRTKNHFISQYLTTNKKDEILKEVKQNRKNKEEKWK